MLSSAWLVWSSAQIHLSSLFPELDVYKGNGAKNMLKKWSLYEIASKTIPPDPLWEDMLVLFRRPWTSSYLIQIFASLSLGSPAGLTYKNISLIHEK